jgi:hypothetical protein
MKLTRRWVIPAFFVLMVLLSGMVFWPFILNEVIKPISLAAWLLLRIFVLSIDQKYYWAGIIFAGFVLLYRLLLPEETPVSSEIYGEPNKTINTIDYWRRLIIPTKRSSHDENILKRELAHLMVALYKTKQRTPVEYRMYEALERGGIPIPERIRAYLFPAEPQKSRRSITSFFQSIQKAAGVWIRWWTGQESAEHYQMVDEVLRYMEISLEMKNDDE